MACQDWPRRVFPRMRRSVAKDRGGGGKSDPPKHQPYAAYHNCSGKHCGFLSASVAHGENSRGYIDPSHPAQRRVTKALSEMTGCDLRRLPLGRDGCGIPVYYMPLRSLALGMARLGDPSGLPEARAEAAKRLLGAMAAEPFYVNGTQRVHKTEVMQCVRGECES